jgi:hypothetical protein
VRCRNGFSGAQRTVIDGPFTPTEEQGAGYWIWNRRFKSEVQQCGIDDMAE